MGKGAALCLNGPYILSHFGPYSDGGTGKYGPREFLIAPAGAQSATSIHFSDWGGGQKLEKYRQKISARFARKVTISFFFCCVWEDMFIQFPQLKI